MLRRCWHAIFGHKDVTVDLTREPWSATCSCGYRLHVTVFELGKLGGS